MTFKRRSAHLAPVEPGPPSERSLSIAMELEPMQRRRFKDVRSFSDRPRQRSNRLREEAEVLSHSPDSDALLKEARRAHVASHMDEWLSSPGLRPPD
jgi:hypothetical protein